MHARDDEAAILQHGLDYTPDGYGGDRLRHDGASPEARAPGTGPQQGSCGSGSAACGSRPTPPRRRSPRQWPPASPSSIRPMRRTASGSGGNERLVARALRGAGRAAGIRIVTKGGMARPQGAWVPDGRAKAIRRDCEASLEALDGLPIDLYLLHAPDPRTPWRTSVRALGRLVDEGLVSRVGLANVTRGRLDEAFELAPVSAVQVALSLLDDRALRGGVVERCAEARSHPDRPLAARRASPCGGSRPATRARRGRGGAFGDAGRGGARMGARPRPERRHDPRRDAARDGSVGRARRIPRAARRRARAASRARAPLDRRRSPAPTRRSCS